MTTLSTEPATAFERLRRTYAAVAVMALNAVVLFVAINLLAAVYFSVKERVRPSNFIVPFTQGYGISIDSLAAMYPGLSNRDIGDLLQETWTDDPPLVYEPFTLFKERPRAGKYIKVDAAGFRVSRNQGPWPPDRSQYRTVFVFGGSTTFGYGVRDEDTVVSHLQPLLDTEPGSRPVRLYNFGRGYYFLSVERILFQQLLSAGFVPDAAVFIDGLNDFAYASGEPAGADRFRKAVEGGSSSRTNLEAIVQRLPATTLARHGMEKLGFRRHDDPDDEASSGITETARGKAIQGVIRRYVDDKKMIETLATPYGVATSFVWQPVPTYKQDLRYYLFSKGGFGLHALSGAGYPVMAKVAPRDPNFIWCADIQVGLSEPLYVDKVHYSPSMSRHLAQCIADGMKKSEQP